MNIPRNHAEICLNCGLCCNDDNLALFLFPQDAISLTSLGYGDILYIEDNENDDPEIRMHTRINGDCLFLDQSTECCRIYDVRPVVCRIFPYGEVDRSEEGSDSRADWILKNCRLFAEYGPRSSLRMESLKLMANAQRLESHLHSHVIRFVRDLNNDREKRLEAQWEFRVTDEYGLTFWATENAYKEEIEQMIEWVQKTVQSTSKPRAASMITFYNRHYRGLCTIQGIFRGNSAFSDQITLPECHEDLLKELDDFLNDDKDSNAVLLEGWEPWPPSEKNPKRDN